MRLAELPVGTGILFDVSIQKQELEFPSEVVEVHDNFILTKPVMSKGKVVGLGGEGVSIAAVTLFEKRTFPKSILFMGKISYSFYLIHYLVVKFYLRVVYFGTNSLLIILGLLVCFMVTVGLSWIYWNIFQKRIPSRLLMFISGR